MKVWNIWHIPWVLPVIGIIESSSCYSVYLVLWRCEVILIKKLQQKGSPETEHKKVMHPGSHF